MENQPAGWFSPLLPFVHSLRSGCRSLGKEKGKTVRKDGLSHERPMAAGESCRLRAALKIILG